MNKIDRCIGAQEITPGAFACVGFAGNEQHAQVFPHALRLDHRLVVDGGQLAWFGLQLDLDDIWAGPVEAQPYRNRLAVGSLYRFNGSRGAAYEKGGERAVGAFSAALCL